MRQSERLTAIAYEQADWWRKRGRARSVGVTALLVLLLDEVDALRTELAEARDALAITQSANALDLEAALVWSKRVDDLETELAEARRLQLRQKLLATAREILDTADHERVEIAADEPTGEVSDVPGIELMEQCDHFIGQGLYIMEEDKAKCGACRGTGWRIPGIAIHRATGEVPDLPLREASE